MIIIIYTLPQMSPVCFKSQRLAQQTESTGVRREGAGNLRVKMHKNKRAPGSHGFLLNSCCGCVGSSEGTREGYFLPGLAPWINVLPSSSSSGRDTFSWCIWEPGAHSPGLWLLPHHHGCPPRLGSSYTSTRCLRSHFRNREDPSHK